MIFSLIIEVSFNRPKFSSCATWNPNASTFAGNETMIQTSTGILINTNNTVYAVSLGLTSVLVWSEGSAYPTKNISLNLSGPFSVFVTTNGDIYGDNGYSNLRIEKWSASTASSTIAMHVIGRCGGVFVDIYDNVYCSLPNYHQVLKGIGDRNPNASLIVAGNGSNGSTANQLTYPHGIFVDIDLSFYVADYGNNRIQWFRADVLDGTTAAGTGAPGTIALKGPSGVLLDGDGYLFIADQANHRIVGSGPSGFRCIAGCTGTNGSAANQFLYPYDLSFDSYGNLYVTDSANLRIQKFTLAKNACGELFFPESSV